MPARSKRVRRRGASAWRSTIACCVSNRNWAFQRNTRGTARSTTFTELESVRAMTQPSPRISPVIFPQTWELPGRPEQGPAAALDAFRQTEFVLKGDLRLLHEGM